MWFGGPRATPAPVDPLPTPALTPGGLDQHQVDSLAWALHERWHGTRLVECERGKAACAEASGAYDDVAAIEPILLAWGIRGAA